MGIEAYKRAETIETSEESWARVVSGMTENEVDHILGQFNSSSVSALLHVDFKTDQLNVILLRTFHH